MKILELHLNLKVPISDLVEPFKELAPAFAQIKGLKWKIWYANDEGTMAGGYYLFEDEASLDAHLNSELHKNVLESPSWSVDQKVFNVLTDFTKITRGPI